jgi:hypothetical protein
MWGAIAIREGTNMLRSKLWTASLALVGALATTSLAEAWEPAKPVTFVIPAGTGGGADQMARFVQGVITKHNLMNQPMVVLNKGGELSRVPRRLFGLSQAASLAGTSRLA